MTPDPPASYPQPFPPRGAGRINWLSAFSGFAVGLVAASLIWVQVLPPEGGGGDQSEFVRVPGDADPNQGAAGEGERRRIIGGGGGRAAQGGGAGGVDVGGGSGGGGSGFVSDAPAGSVTGNLIKLGATVAEDGIAKAFLGEVRFGMEAVRARVNAAGGIEGRQLEIIYKQDAWDPKRGQDFIKRLILEDKVFALAVSPSSEGLNAASGAGLFKDHGVPVVGADGLNNTQFLDPWIWPVAAATTTQVHVIMKDAWERCQSNATCKGGGLRPAIVFGNTYRFGVEGAFAFNGAYCRLTGGDFTERGKCNGGKNIPGFTPGGTACQANPPTAGRFCGIEAGKNPVQERGTVQTACKAHGEVGPCNFILLLLEPATALAWMGGFDPATAFESDGGCCGMAGAQPLFTSNFGVECKTKCHKMRVWSGYNPPIGAYANNQAVASYVRDLKAQNSRADEFNQFTMGGYIGMKLLEEALRQVGRDLSRERLVQTLNSMPPLTTGLTTPDGLRWTAQDRYANQSAQSFSIQYPVNRFTGWNPEAPYTRDPWLGRDNVLP